jgi:uncharacterized protein YqhQ
LALAPLLAPVLIAANAGPRAAKDPDSGAALHPVGGQAVLEGVMMRGDTSWTVTVRHPDGSLRSLATPHQAWTRRRKWLGLPLIRGPVVLFDSLIVGLKALDFSATIMEEAEDAASEAAASEAAACVAVPCGAVSSEAVASVASDAEAPAAAAPTPSPARPASPDDPLGPGLNATNAKDAQDAQNAASAPNSKGAASSGPAGGPEAASKVGGALRFALSLVLGVGLALALFVALPHLLSALLGSGLGFDQNGVVFHLVDGTLKFAILVGYIRIIALMGPIGRLYAYHGAEHQSIHLHESGRPLTPEAAAGFPTWHPRCGTAFLFLLLAFSVLFFAVVFPLWLDFGALGPVRSALAGAAVKIPLTLPLAGLAYEITRLAGRHRRSRLLAWLIWPGLLLQRLTTRRPDLGQLEVAIESLRSVLAADAAAAASGRSGG